MVKKLGVFFRPYGITIFIFLALTLLTPVVYVYSEPERTNYRPGEEQRWFFKTTRYEGLLSEYLFHTEGDLDILVEIANRDYVTNYIGVPLLCLYYVIAAGINSAIRQLRYWFRVSNKPEDDYE